MWICSARGHICSFPPQGAIFFKISNVIRVERYSHILIWCGWIFIKGRTCNNECRKECSFTKLVYPFNNEMIWFVILMHQKPFLSLKTSLFQVYGNIEIVEGYSSQIYSCGKQFNLLEEYSPLYLSSGICTSCREGMQVGASNFWYLEKLLSPNKVCASQTEKWGYGKQ